IKTGYTFDGWNTAANGSGTDYAEGENYTANVGVTLYAKWTINVFVCGDDVSFTYNGSPVTYGTVSNATTGKCWLDRNLGATQKAVASNDSAAYGHLFQWGRPADGHQVRNSGTQTGQVETITPGTNTFILLNWPTDEWSSTDSNGALRSAYLAKTDGEGICPAGFRLPTGAEWDAERVSWSSNNATGAFASTLKLPATGYRYYSINGLNQVGESGQYWSSTVDATYSPTYSRCLSFAASSGSVNSTARTYGFAVRCIKED
ncbi:MAG: FISUMP domain-containing protein, partial [Candidatus Gracilibacteria bacterium]|nr:FISUMP domain-containing protein [Candidatus Gracilibacteria bacterium]